MSCLFDVIGDALRSSFPSLTVCSGAAPAEAHEGSLFYGIDKLISQKDDANGLVTVRYRYFPKGTPSAADHGAVLISALSVINLDSDEIAAEKFECKGYGRYIDAAATYSVPRRMLDISGDDGSNAAVWKSISLKISFGADASVIGRSI